MSSTASADASSPTDASNSSAAASPSPPQVVVNDGSVASIVTIVVLIISTLSILARLGTKWVVSRAFHIDDGLAGFALITHLASGILVPVMSSNGLGTPMESLSAGQVNTFERALFASDILFIFTLVSAKISIVFLFRLVSSEKRHVYMGNGLGGFTLMWGVASIFAISFGCQLPDTWDLSGKCIDHASFWEAFGAINIITDLAFFMLPLYITIPLYMSKAKKAVVLSCFAARLLDIVVTATQLGYVSAFESADLTNDLARWILLSQVIQCVTIVTSCVPYLRPLLEAFPSGMYDNGDFIRNKTSTMNSAQYIRTPEAAYTLNSIRREQSGIHVSTTVDITSSGGSANETRPGVAL